MKFSKKNPQPLKDFYDVLGVPKNVTDQGIQKAFRKLARKYHPDINQEDPDASDKFADVAVAYKILKSEEKRNEVDARIISEYCMSLLDSRKRTGPRDTKIGITSGLLGILKKDDPR